MSRKSRRQKPKKRKTTPRPGKAKRIFRENPGLSQALKSTWPLEMCRINPDWREAQIATVVVVRKMAGNIVMGTYYVDLLGWGLKDCYGNPDLSRGELAELLSRLDATVKGRMGDVPEAHCVDFDIQQAADLIHGAVTWTKRHRFRLPRDYDIWLRLLPPGNAEPDVSLYGQDGKPVLVDTGLYDDDDFEPDDDLDEDEEFDEEDEEFYDDVFDEDMEDEASPPIPKFSREGMERTQAAIQRILDSKEFATQEEETEYLNQQIKRNQGNYTEPAGGRPERRGAGPLLGRVGRA